MLRQLLPPAHFQVLFINQALLSGKTALHHSRERRAPKLPNELRFGSLSPGNAYAYSSWFRKFWKTGRRNAKPAIDYLPSLLSSLSGSPIEDFKKREVSEYFPLLTTGALTGTTSDTYAAGIVLDYFTQVWGLGREVIAALSSPIAVVKILRTRPNDYSVPGGVEFGANGEIQILGVPIIPCQFMTWPAILAGDFARGAGMAQTEELSLRTSEKDGTNFSPNLVTNRMEGTENLMIFSPKSFVYGTV